MNSRIMKRLSATGVFSALAQITAVCIAAVALPSVGHSQEPIPEAKKQLVTELIVVMQLEQNSQKTLEAVMAQMATQFPQMLTEVSATRKDLTPEQQEQVKREAARGLERSLARFRERLGALYTSREFFEQVYYPVYAKYFTESDLRDLLLFYQSPTGQKMLRVQPEFLADTLKRSFEVVGPKLQQMMQELVKEELERIKNEK